MLTVRILCVGKCKEKYWREACAEYGKRLSAFCRFEVLEVDEERLPERASKGQIEIPGITYRQVAKMSFRG